MFNYSIVKFSMISKIKNNNNVTLPLILPPHKRERETITGTDNDCRSIEARVSEINNNVHCCYFLVLVGTFFFLLAWRRIRLYVHDQKQLLLFLASDDVSNAFLKTTIYCSLLLHACVQLSWQAVHVFPIKVKVCWNE